MNEHIINVWNSLIAPEDIVFHLGDVALGPWVEWDGVLSRLNGRIILVAGNHDRVSDVYNEKQRTRFTPEYEKWFDEIHQNLAGIELDDGTVVNLSHYPYDGDHTDEDRYSEFRLKDDGKTPLIHGHTHLDQIFSRSKKGTRQIHVGMDAWSYTPVSEDQVINALHELG
jgi:calcineurin-like phosphoesterase family protein